MRVSSGRISSLLTFWGDAYSSIAGAVAYDYGISSCSTTPAGRVFESISNLPARLKCRVQHQACSVFAAVQRIVSHGGRTEAFGRHEALP
jgi:hypothetical protein